MRCMGNFSQKRESIGRMGAPGANIDSYMYGKPLGFVKTLRQDIGVLPFNTHCTRDDRFVTKLMSTHGLLNKVPDYPNYQNKYGERVTFKYTEYLSYHNHSKHWVDDVNNRRHDPIGIEQVWSTKWWSAQKFTFVFSVTKSKALYSRYRGRKVIPEPQL